MGSLPLSWRCLLCCVLICEAVAGGMRPPSTVALVQDGGDNSRRARLATVQIVAKGVLSGTEWSGTTAQECEDQASPNQALQGSSMEDRRYPLGSGAIVS